MDTGLVTGVDAGLWILMAKNGDGPQNVADLADTLGFDPVLLGESLCLVSTAIGLCVAIFHLHTKLLRA